jgi:hypothetical protein
MPELQELIASASKVAFEAGERHERHRLAKVLEDYLELTNYSVEAEGPTLTPNGTSVFKRL